VFRGIADSHLLFSGGGEISNGIGKTIRSVLRGAVVRGLAVGVGVVVGVFGVGVGSALGAVTHEFEKGFWFGRVWGWGVVRSWWGCCGSVRQDVCLWLIRGIRVLTTTETIPVID